MPTAVAAPSSWASSCENCCARDRYVGDVVADVMASARPWAVTAVRRNGGVAAPRSRRRCAQNDWSTIPATGTDGTPARRAAAVVPAPPWWTMAAICGNSHACGTSSMVRMSSPAQRSRAHPDCTRPEPLRCAALGRSSRRVDHHGRWRCCRTRRIPVVVRRPGSRPVSWVVANRRRRWPPITGDIQTGAPISWSGHMLAEAVRDGPDPKCGVGPR